MARHLSKEGAASKNESTPRAIGASTGNSQFALRARELFCRELLRHCLVLLECRQGLLRELRNLSIGGTSRAFE